MGDLNTFFGIFNALFLEFKMQILVLKTTINIVNSWIQTNAPY